MGVMNPGRNLYLASIVTSPDVKRQVSNGVLATEIKRRLDAAHILTQGQPNRIPSPLLVYTVESEFHLGWQRIETVVQIYTNSSLPVDSLDISKIVSQSWNAVSLANGNGITLGVTDGVTQDRPLGRNTCPPGEIFEAGGRSDTLAWESGPLGLLGGAVTALIPTEETFYQVRAVHCPVPATGDVPHGTTGFVDSLTTSAVRDSNVASQIGTSTAQYQLPSMSDVSNAAHAAGEAVNRTITETVAGVTGMGAGDIKFIAYAGLGIVGALVFVKILKEVKAI